MKNLIYDFRFLFYGLVCGIPIGEVVTRYTDLDIIPHISMCMIIMVGLFPIISALDNKLIKRKGDN